MVHSCSVPMLIKRLWSNYFIKGNRLGIWRANIHSWQLFETISALLVLLKWWWWLRQRWWLSVCEFWIPIYGFDNAFFFSFTLHWALGYRVCANTHMLCKAKWWLRTMPRILNWDKDTPTHASNTINDFDCIERKYHAKKRRRHKMKRKSLSKSFCVRCCQWNWNKCRSISLYKTITNFISTW